MFDELYANEQEPDEDQEQGETVPELEEYSEDEIDDLFDWIAGK